MNRHLRKTVCFAVVITLTAGFATSNVDGAGDAAEERIAEFFQRSRSARTLADQKSLVLELLPAADEMLLADDFQSALRLTTLARDLARKARNNHLLTLANAKREHVSDVIKEHKDVAGDFKTLRACVRTGLVERSG